MEKTTAVKRLLKYKWMGLLLVAALAYPTHSVYKEYTAPLPLSLPLPHVYFVNEATGEELKGIPYRLVRTSTGQERNARTGTDGETTLNPAEINPDGPDELKVYYTGDRDINHGW